MVAIRRRRNRNDATNIREYLESSRADKWGFFIYRTCYYHDNPERWTQFMERLKECASTKLLDSSVDPEGDGAAIIDKLEWNAQEDPALEGCSVDDVRCRHRDLMRSMSAINTLYWLIRSLSTVLSGPVPGTWRFQDFIDPTAYIIIIDIQWGDCLDHNDKGNGDGEVDEGWPPINGCPFYDVGWMKVPVNQFIPRLHGLLSEHGNLWCVCYARPPKISQSSNCMNIVSRGSGWQMIQTHVEQVR